MKHRYHPETVQLSTAITIPVVQLMRQEAARLLNRKLDASSFSVSMEFDTPTDDGPPQITLNGMFKWQPKDLPLTDENALDLTLSLEIEVGDSGPMRVKFPSPKFPRNGTQAVGHRRGAVDELLSNEDVASMDDGVVALFTEVNGDEHLMVELTAEDRAVLKPAVLRLQSQLAALERTPKAPSAHPFTAGF